MHDDSNTDAEEPIDVEKELELVIKAVEPDLKDAVKRGYAKSPVYTGKPLEHLKTNIRQVIAEIPPEMYAKVIEITPIVIVT